MKKVILIVAIIIAVLLIGYFVVYRYVQFDSSYYKLPHLVNWRYPKIKLPPDTEYFATSPSGELQFLTELTEKEVVKFYKELDKTLQPVRRKRGSYRIGHYDEKEGIIYLELVGFDTLDGKLRYYMTFAYYNDEDWELVETD